MDKPFHVSQATLDLDTSSTESQTSVWAVVNKNAPALIANLDDEVSQVRLDLGFGRGDDITFYLKGDNSCQVHLTGYYLEIEAESATDIFEPYRTSNQRSNQIDFGHSNKATFGNSGGFGPVRGMNFISNSQWKLFLYLILLTASNLSDATGLGFRSFVKPESSSQKSEKNRSNAGKNSY